MTPKAKTLISPSRRNLIIEDALFRRVKEQARKEDRTVSSLVRLALKEYLEKHGG
jgi:hypothetical protein